MTELDRKQETAYTEAYETRAMNLALRLLDGIGSASVHAYHDQPMHPMTLVSHGRTTTGEFVVSTLVDESMPVGAQPAGQPFPVRVEIVREAPAPHLRLVSGSIHMLGTMTWLDEIETARLIAEGAIPEHVAFLASAAGGRLGFVNSRRAVVNSDTGITAFQIDVLGESGIVPFPGRKDDLACYDTVESLSEDNLSMICEAARTKQIDGVVQFHPEFDKSCPHLYDTVVCVDADPHGLSLIQFRENGSFQAFVPFDVPVSTITELREQLDLLLINCDQ